MLIFAKFDREAAVLSKSCFTIYEPDIYYVIVASFKVNSCLNK
jgi:hypothetical protein